MEPSEQASGRPSPKSRRRRWLIVSVVLVLMSAAAWWYWPRGDARFVGSWEYGSEADPVKALMVLRRNGTGWINTTNGYRMTFPWKVANNRMIIGSNPGGVLGRVRGYVAEKMMTASKSTFLSTEQSYPIVECTPNVIRVREGTQEMILTRIVE